MEQEIKKKGKPLWMGILGILTAGAVITTTNGLQREGVRVKQYAELAPKSYCTVLVYMDGSDLESDYGAAADDLREMEQAVRDAGMESGSLRVVVEAGGASQWQYETMQNKEYGRFCISSEGIQQEEELEIRNMGSADTLTDFINYGVQSYPAEHYGLVLWNHGAGQIEGFGRDNQFAAASLPLESIKDAMEASAMNASFDFVSLDACLMGNLELVSLLRDKTDYLIASEELEPQNGYDYDWLRAIGKEKEEPSDSFGKAVGEAMLSSYEASYADNDYKLTLSLIDVDAYDAFHDTFHQVVESVLDHTDEDLYQQLGQMRKELQGFGSRQEGMASEIVDVMDLVEVIGTLQENQELCRLAEEQFQKLVPEKVTKGYQEEPCGLSIYLPSGANEWLQDDMAVYDGMSFCETYREWIRHYRDYLVKENKMEWRTPSREKKKIHLDMEPDQIENIAGAYLATFCQTEDGISYLLSTDSDVTINRNGFLEASPAETYWGLQGKVLCLVETLNTEECTEYHAPILYNEELCMIIIGFDEDNPDGVIQGITPVEVSKQEYEIQEGDRIVPLYPLEDTVEKEEKIYNQSYYMGDPISIISLEGGDARLEQITVNQDSCSYGFLIQDTKQKLYYTDRVGKL